MSVEEVVDGLPVLHTPEDVQAPPAPAVVTAQAAAVAGAGLVAGATAVAVIRGRRWRRARRNQLRLGRGRRAQRLQVLGTRSFLVDVHLLERRG